MCLEGWYCGGLGETAAQQAFTIQERPERGHHVRMCRLVLSPLIDHVLVALSSWWLKRKQERRLTDMRCVDHAWSCRNRGIRTTFLTAHCSVFSPFTQAQERKIAGAQ